MDRCLDSRRHVTDPTQGFRHGVGGFSEGDQLAISIRRFGKLKRRLRTGFLLFDERLFYFGGITDQCVRKMPLWFARSLPLRSPL